MWDLPSVRRQRQQGRPASPARAVRGGGFESGDARECDERTRARVGRVKSAGHSARRSGGSLLRDFGGESADRLLELREAERLDEVVAEAGLLAATDVFVHAVAA